MDFQSKHTELDPGFARFYQWAKDSNIPVIVLSGGIESMIRALLSKLLGSVEAAEIELFSNKIIARCADEDKSGRDWEVQLHDDSPFGMDKSVCISTYAEMISKLPESQRPALLFAGDGVSDLSAARSTDLLFAKRGQGAY
jgi:2,3-diketo-5-methylthio-1-phosphopentane phosphatase